MIPQPRTFGLLLLTCLCSGIRAQSVAAAPAFDVVIIKPNTSGGQGVHVSVRSATFLGTNVPLSELIGEAYGVQLKRVVGLPKWAEDARYDVNAKVVDPGPEILKGTTDPQRQAMLAKVLADRFGLKVHQETRTLPVYDLVTAKDGPKFTVSTATPLTEEEKLAGTRQGPGSISVHGGDLIATAVEIDRLVLDLSGMVDRMVVEKTGLTAKYDLRLHYLPEGRPELPDSPPGIFTALEEQLGLKLVGAKGPVPVIIVDAVSLPTEN